MISKFTLKLKTVHIALFYIYLNNKINFYAYNNIIKFESNQLARLVLVLRFFNFAGNVFIILKQERHFLSEAQKVS